MDGTKYTEKTRSCPVDCIVGSPIDVCGVGYRRDVFVLHHNSSGREGEDGHVFVPRDPKRQRGFFFARPFMMV